MYVLLLDVRLSKANSNYVTDQAPIDESKSS